jgi:hypothetical protein
MIPLLIPYKISDANISIVEWHIFVYAFPEGMLNTFVEVLGLENKKDIIRRMRKQSLLFQED